MIVSRVLSGVDAFAGPGSHGGRPRSCTLGEPGAEAPAEQQPHGTSLAANSGEAIMGTDQVETQGCSSEADEQVSLDIHNAVWPDQAVTMAEVRSFKSSTRARHLRGRRTSPRGRSGG